MSQLLDIRRRHGARRSALQKTMQDPSALRREYRAAMQDAAILIGILYRDQRSQRRLKEPVTVESEGEA